MKETVHSQSAQQTEQLGQKLALNLLQNQAPITASAQGCIIFLTGDLGSGKTTFCRGLIQALTNETIVKSPTYEIIKVYPTKYDFTLYHIDLYRIKSIDELEYMGLFDHLVHNTIALIEWPQSLLDGLTEQALAIHFDTQQGCDDNDRTITLDIPDKFPIQLR